MKKLLRVSLLFIAVTLFFTACSEDDDQEDFIIEYTSLPTIAKNLLTYFGGESQITSIKERYVADSKGVFYTVYAIGGYEIEFNKSGSWIHIDGENKEVPSGLFGTEIPTAIKTYVEKNYSSLKIIDVTKNNDGFEVELSDSKDLFFDKDGVFLR